jgi:arylsulfatase
MTFFKQSKINNIMFKRALITLSFAALVACNAGFTSVNKSNGDNTGAPQAELKKVLHETVTKPGSGNSKRPNVLLVVADDLGTLDIGAFGSEIRTPNIDRLANAGVRFSNFHTSATCSPTRAMLLSGSDSHSAGLGNMIEHMAPNQRGQAGYEGHLSPNVVTVAELLRNSGYRTYMAGKWHLGKEDKQLPYRRGFDQSFVMLEGGASYFNDQMGLTTMVATASYRHNGEMITELPDDFYASEYYADFVINQIESGGASDQPFFAYLAFTAPHWPLQVRDKDLDLYRGRYDAGYDALFDERIHAGKKLGSIPEQTLSAPRSAHVQPWSALTPEQQRQQSRVMEIYSAVVERMDFHLGRVLDHLEKTGELDNTLIVFMSDNGADGSDRSKLPGNKKWLAEAWDLSYENMGKIKSYVYPGAAWARASVGPYRMYKEFLSEGGIRSPAIIAYPGMTNQGAMRDEFMTVQDITPTILEYTGVKHPGAEYQGRTVKPMTGVSLLPFMKDSNEPPHTDQQVTAWELFGNRAVRKGDWKLLWLSSKPKWLVTPSSADQWGLYNLAQDPAELNNLAADEPEKMAEMLSLWQQYVKDQQVILPDWESKP